MVATEHVGGVLGVGRQEVVGQHLVQDQRPEVEPARRELAAERLRLAQRCALERGHDRERGAPVVQQLLDRLRTLHEPAVHGLEVEEELGDVLEELASEPAVGHLVEGPAGGVEHAPAAATADAVGHGDPAQQSTAEELGHKPAPGKSIAVRVGGVAMSIRSYPPLAWISYSRSSAM